MQAPWGAVLVCRPLLTYADHFFTAATLTLRDSQEEWGNLAAHVGVPPDKLRLLHQVHGRAIAAVPAEDQSRWTAPEADGAITSDRSVALVIRVADCAPVLLADRRRGVTAAVHAGWRSTLQRILPAAVDAMMIQFGTDPADLVAAIGPSLGVCCGEMGDEVVEAFRAAGHDERTLERWFTRPEGQRARFDLWRANREQLETCGVPSAAIHVAGLCTRSHPQVFHSYRAAGPGAGRMAAVIKRR